MAMINDRTGTQPDCAGTREGEEAKLHPLVILNISDHWTKMKAESAGNQAKKVYGALLGKNEGRVLEVVNSFDMVVYDVDTNVTIDHAYLQKREAQYKEVFPEMDLIGWYTTGDIEATDHDMMVQMLFNKYTETVKTDPVNSILLKLDPCTAGPDGKLPIAFWETTLDCTTNTTGVKGIPWVLVSEESERIGVDHVTRLSTKTGTNNQDSEVAKQIRSNSSAVSMLVQRVEMIHTYLQKVLAEELPFNEMIVREADKLCRMIIRLNPEEYNEAFETQESDVKAALLLSKMTEACGGLGQLVAKVNQLANDRSGMHGQMPIRQSKPLPKDSMKPGSSGVQPDLFNF